MNLFLFFQEVLSKSKEKTVCWKRMSNINTSVMKYYGGIISRRPFWWCSTEHSNGRSNEQSWSYHLVCLNIWCIRRLRWKTGSEALTLLKSEATNCSQEGSHKAEKCKCVLLVTKEFWEGVEYPPGTGISSCCPRIQFWAFSSGQTPHFRSHFFPVKQKTAVTAAWQYLKPCCLPCCVTAKILHVNVLVAGLTYQELQSWHGKLNQHLLIF